MNELAQQIRQTLEATDFIDRAFPALRQWGLRDEDVFVHSLGCSLWNSLGHEAGYMAVVEAPAPFAVGNDIRSDSVWFRRETGDPAVLIEFERYDGSHRAKDKLEGKLANLRTAHARWDGKPDLLVLSAWSVGVVSAPDISTMLARTSATVKSVADTRGAYTACQLLLFYRFIFHKDRSGLLKLERLASWEGL
ncbi:hypothetical protein Thiowin_01499 [Thiorhodovibrio winogradskyi]|uniref:Restriction endonuclease n=1 Tax=Thiorhodovibrio winogradskyi TaxID=77007 RepID=A0ABZ0S7P8_9GAMM|nr:hypothetical protein [Thiorhodovibrio winogradskyi]